jgi:EmrB/QacA subfamily drug resistance transporter
MAIITAGTRPVSARPSTDRRGLALAAMMFAVAMTFIDQTIVSVAAPRIQSELGLSNTGLQWGVNAYLLAMAAMFAFGGRLADTAGHRRMVTIGIVVFAAASALAGLTPAGPLAEPWLITFRAVQGVGGALMYPAALAIVVNAYRTEERGKGLALFFGIAGGLTAVGPALGGYLTAWTWRSIFWINVPVALIALVLLARAKPADERRPAQLDVPGLTLITAGVASSVFGLQQSARWGWTNPLTVGAVALGAALLVAFVLVELRAATPLMNLSIFADRSFRVENLILFLTMIVFVPVFFFASEYGQVALGQTPARASLMLFYFFAGFVVAAQVGGRMLDRAGARRPILLGSVLAAIGLNGWAGHVATLSVGPQVAFIVLSGAGLGLLLGPANTDALNHAPSTAYGEATGITQTVRNFGASLGLAVLGTLLVTRFRTHLTASLTAHGAPPARAHDLAAGIAQLERPSGGSTAAIPHFVQLDFAHATGSVLTAMSWVMVAVAVVAFAGLPRSKSQPQPATIGGIQS